MKAEQVMQQPGDSLPHDDHIHVRIACEPEEYATGCDGGGPQWRGFEDITYDPLNDHFYVLVEAVDHGGVFMAEVHEYDADGRHLQVETRRPHGDFLLPYGRRWENRDRANDGEHRNCADRLRHQRRH